jgi:hypothetical protein
MAIAKNDRKNGTIIFTGRTTTNQGTTWLAASFCREGFPVFTVQSAGTPLKNLLAGIPVYPSPGMGVKDQR